MAGSPLEARFLEILNGYLAACHKTSASFAVCNFPDGTMLKGSLAASGKTYDSVSRMMPAISAWQVGGQRTGAIHRRTEPDLTEVLVSTFRNAFNPAHPDYWMPSPPQHQNQRQVESSLVAWSIYLLGDEFLAKLQSEDRANIQAWLASGTQVPVRRNNWAWFTAVNQAARLVLSARWKEFKGDERWMLDDVSFLDTLAAPADGWYSDSPADPIYDYYNFWVFASHFLYWNKMVGSRYLQWSERFRSRLQQFLLSTPYFFGSNGSHVLFGRSLIYRWAVVTPLVLAYLQNLWPYSPGLLRSIVERNIDFAWNIGAFDAKLGKLLETYTPEGSRLLRESYVDNGHPYWGMQAFALFLIPKGDPFWSAKAEPLPVEKGDFIRRLDALGMLLAGTKSSGQVRWAQSRVNRVDIHYRDKYSKFSYLSHFPFNLSQSTRDLVADNAIVFRNRVTGECAYRKHVVRGSIAGNATHTLWNATLGGTTFEIDSRIEFIGDFERRTHRVSANGDVKDVDVIEGSAALGGELEGAPPLLRSTEGSAIAAWTGSKQDRIDVLRTEGQNVIHRRAAVLTYTTPVRVKPFTLTHVFYASPVPLEHQALDSRARELLQSS